MAGTIAVIAAAGCGGAAEQAEAPEPKTVVVTVAEQPGENTVEATGERKIEATATLSPPQPTASGTATSSGSSPTEADITCEFGQPCDLSGSTVTVTRVQFFRGVQHLGETLEGYFVAVDFEYTFYEEEPTQTGQIPFWLSDENGNTYSLDTTATSSYGIDADRHLSHTVVQPGVTTPGAAVFKVAPQAEGFTLLIQDLFLPDTRKTAKITLPEALW